jgi:leader peptidase (prepilin peptidase) / N-methyltransferase
MQNARQRSDLYLAILATTAVIGASIAISPNYILSVPISILGAIMLAITIIDVRSFRIPDVLSYPATLAGLVVTHWLLPGMLPDHLMATLIAGGGLWFMRFVYWRVRGVEGIGFGDVKLLATAGAWVGPEGAIPVLFLASVTALMVIAGLCVVSGRKFAASSRVPFGAFLAPAIWIVFVAKLHATTMLH